MSNLYVYSTLSADQDYNGILVAGKANVADRHLHTPKGVATKLTEAELQQARTSVVFKAHVKNGFLIVADKKEDPDDVAKDMAGKDKSAQETDKSLKKKGGAKKAD